MPLKLHASTRWTRGIGGPPDNSPPATVPRRAKMVADGEPEFVAGRASQAESSVFPTRSLRRQRYELPLPCCSER